MRVAKPSVLKKSKFVLKLMDWGRDNRRDFSWRHSTDAYEIYVAESLLQRTKAGQVGRVFARFLEKWPTIRSLSEANPKEVGLVIRTLGLDYRIRRMNAIAREVACCFAGRIPDSLIQLKQLYGMGFGDYMAHAILCFAYGQDVPVVDKNVERILKRVFSVKTRMDGHRDPTLWSFAERLVPRGKAKEYNWSLIDFGALVCTPKSPKCTTCPLLEICDYVKDLSKTTTDPLP